MTHVFFFLKNLFTCMCVHLCMFVHVCIYTDTSSRAWWYVLVIPAFRRRMQKDLEFKATKRSFSKTKKSWQMNIDTIKMNFISIQLCHLSSYVIRIKIPRGKEVIKTVQWIKALVAQPDHLSSTPESTCGGGGWGGSNSRKAFWSPHGCHSICTKAQRLPGRQETSFQL